MAQRPPAALPLLALGMTLLVGCSEEGSSRSSDGYPASKAVAVEVTEVTRGPIERLLMTSRELVAEQEVKVVSRTANRVVQLLVEEGDVVQENQLLARLEDDIQRTALAKAENQANKSREEFARQQSCLLYTSPRPRD